MTVSFSTDWTTPAAYLRGAAPVPRWRLIFARLSAALDQHRIAARHRREARKLLRLRAATVDLPDYLQRDIGLPPLGPNWTDYR